MKPPKCNTIQELNYLFFKLGEIAGAKDALNEQMRTIPSRIAKEISSKSERLEAARYLYWCTDIPASNIAKALLGINSKGSAASQFYAQIGTYKSEVVCERCHAAIVCENREELQDLQKEKGDHIFHWDGGRVQKLCKPCREIAWTEQVAKRMAAKATV